MQTIIAVQKSCIDSKLMHLISVWSDSEINFHFATILIHFFALQYLQQTSCIKNITVWLWWSLKFSIFIPKQVQKSYGNKINIYASKFIYASSFMHLCNIYASKFWASNYSCKIFGKRIIQSAKTSFCINSDIFIYIM